MNYEGARRPLAAPDGETMHRRGSARTFIKVCGIATIADAIRCADLGVDAVGIILTKPDVPRSAGSDRRTPEEAAAIVGALPRSLQAVLLIHVLELDAIIALCEQTRPGALQIQVPLAPLDLRAIAQRAPWLDIFKKFSVNPETVLDELVDQIREYHETGAIDAVLLDSAHGGSGRVHNWKLAAQVVERLPDVRILLAGGLTPANVAEAVREVRPYGVDVMSGVNGSTRDAKDPAKLLDFVNAVRSEDDR